MTFAADSHSETGSGEENQDLALTGPDWALVLDGANPPAGVDVGCVHGVAWIVGRLGAHLHDRIREGSLRDVLRSAIRATAADHGPACDLAHPRSPGATAAVVRMNGDQAEWLVVGDAAILFESTGGDVTMETDNRMYELPDPPDTVEGIRAYIDRYRNKPGGAWFAGAVPEAADHAYAGSRPAAGVRRILLCSNGITRLTYRFGYGLPELMAFAAQGPKPLVQAVRAAELDDPDPDRWSGKRHDDATAVVIDLP
ncbi:protein phosphatase 2C domain-containing protein [Glycomyces sp. NPDC048151]|uniref:protein phosphatase 2C domain-containing protein n=1 Tax=Glycomyces sp. NPDC048151 TaxID=3364002 RepID=UPI0037121649